MNFLSRPTSAFAAALAFALPMAASVSAQAQEEPAALVKRISADVIDTAKNDKSIKAGDTTRITQLVDTKVMPSVNFEVATRSAVGPAWRNATPEQRSQLEAEFKTLLLRLYAGALTQVGDQTVNVTKTVPAAGGLQTVVQTEVRGSGEPVKLDYRLLKSGSDWKIIDVNVGGIWLVQNYRSQFAGEISKGGVDGLIKSLADRNKSSKS
ncbi:MAG: ABC transporter substrate-binding protein [Pseudomonadota bacterium]|nr:ABC transporter substrate-binding protein [Pseudomonadota bacterium]